MKNSAAPTAWKIDILAPMYQFLKQTTYEIGKYGHLRLDFIKKHPRGTSPLLTEGRLNEHLHIIDEQVHEQIYLYIAQMAKRLGMTEEAKDSDPLHWVQTMNSIKASAVEIVL